MSKLKILPVLLGALVLGLSGIAQAQNLLLNGDLELPPGATDPMNVTPMFWSLAEGPNSVEDPNPAHGGNVCGSPHTPGPCPTNTSQVRDFGENTAVPGGTQGLWLRSFMGNLDGAANERPETVFAHLTQTVPHVPMPGMNKYVMTGWANFGTNYAGGVDLLDSNRTVPGNDMLGGPSPTDTEFAIEFLDGGGGIISDVVIELRANGQVNGAGWKEHMLMGFAPPGTANVRVRASMIDGTFNTDPGQSALMDDFSLTKTVPEPTSVALGLIGVLGLVGLMRRR